MEKIREELAARAQIASPELLSDEECKQLWQQYQEEPETKEEPSKDLAQLLEELELKNTGASTQEPIEEDDYDEKGDDDEVKVYWNRPPTHSEWIQLSTV